MAGYLPADSVTLLPSETAAVAGAGMPLSRTPFIFIDLLRMHCDGDRAFRRFHRRKQLVQRPRQSMALGPKKASSDRGLIMGQTLV